MGATTSRLIDAFRTGAWLTRGRARLWGVAVVIAAAGALAYLVASAHGIVDFRNRPLGTDFAGFYAAGSLAMKGDVAAPYDVTRLHAGEQAVFGADAPLYSFSYPPFFLFVAAALARLPYGLALALWQGASLAFYLLALRAICASDAEGGLARDRLWLLFALGFPAVFVNLAHGQNGLLTAALLGGALALLEFRPMLAGALFGCLAYKPQFAAMIPLALAAGGYWRSLAAAAGTVAMLVVATLAAFGPEAWRGFIASPEFVRVVALESGAGVWHKMQSVFAWTRMWGGSVALAYAAQGAVILAVGATLVWLWRGPIPFSLKAAALCLAVPLVTPYSYDYDLTVLAPAIAFFAAYGATHGFGAFDKTALAALWIMPLLARVVAGATLLPLAVPTMLTAYALALRAALRNVPDARVAPSGFPPADAGRAYRLNSR